MKKKWIGAVGLMALALVCGSSECKKVDPEDPEDITGAYWSSYYKDEWDIENGHNEVYMGDVELDVFRLDDTTIYIDGYSLHYSSYSTDWEVIYTEGYGHNYEVARFYPDQDSLFFLTSGGGLGAGTIERYYGKKMN